MGQKEEALAILKLLVSKFPLDEEAKIAKKNKERLLKNEGQSAV